MCYENRTSVFAIDTDTAGLSPFFLPSIILIVRKTHPTTYSALERPVAPFFSLITAWAAAMRAMGIRMGEHDT